jgi:hypothetical protein
MKMPAPCHSRRMSGQLLKRIYFDPNSCDVGQQHRRSHQGGRFSRFLVSNCLLREIAQASWERMGCPVGLSTVGAMI